MAKTDNELMGLEKELRGLRGAEADAIRVTTLAALTPEEFERYVGFRKQADQRAITQLQRNPKDEFLRNNPLERQLLISRLLYGTPRAEIDALFERGRQSGRGFETGAVVIPDDGKKPRIQVKKKALPPPSADDTTRSIEEIIFGNDASTPSTPSASHSDVADWGEMTEDWE